jgi:hypothetical protein
VITRLLLRRGWVGGGGVGGGGGGGGYSVACLHASSSEVLRHTGETETLLVTTVTEVSPPFRGVPQIWRSRSGYKSIAVSFRDQLVCSRLLATPAHPPAWLNVGYVSFLSGSSKRETETIFFSMFIDPGYFLRSLGNAQV